MWRKSITQLFSVTIGNNKVAVTDDGLHDILDSVLERHVGRGIRRAQLRLLNGLLNGILDGGSRDAFCEKEEG